jgi:hypothetical protein
MTLLLRLHLFEAARGMIKDAALQQQLVHGMLGSARTNMLRMDDALASG